MKVGQDSCDDNLSDASDDGVKTETLIKEEIKFLSIKKIVEDMENMIENVKEITKIPAPTARILLNHFKWNKDQLLERLYDSDQESLFSRACVINPYDVRSEVSKTPEECEICILNMSPEKLTGLQCGHQFCEDCWREYLTIQIMQQGRADSIACAAYDCNILVDYDTVMRLFREGDVKVKYLQLIINNFVKCNKSLKWCSKTDCSFVIKVDASVDKMVTCRCGHTFCILCSENDHDPITCELLQRWNSISIGNTSLMSEKLMKLVDTRKCRRCHYIVKKIVGCNYVFCPEEFCKFYFCWLCGESMNDHVDDYHCNKYSDVGTNAENSIRRLTHYYHRYRNHVYSLKLEEIQFKDISLKIDELQINQKIPYADLTFLPLIIDKLRKCRQSLIYTYIFAFYLNSKNCHTLLFENYQSDLEKATECLAETLQVGITLENIYDLREEMINKGNFCVSVRDIISKHVHDGYKKKWWTFRNKI